MAVGGCIVDSGNFDWEAHADKFPGLTTPDDSYHGIIYTERFGKGLLYQAGFSLSIVRLPLFPFLLNCSILEQPLN